MAKCQIIVADLSKYEGRRASIRFAELDIRSTLHDHHGHTSVGFYELANDNVKAGHGTLSYEKHCKAMSKCKHAAVILTRLLNSRLPGKDHGEDISLADQGRAMATVGDTIVIADETYSEGQEIHAHSWNMFLSIEMRFPTASLERIIKSTQYLQISCSTLKHDHTLFTQQGAPVYEHINIVSGICLFNGQILESSVSGSEGGRVDPSILNTKPTLQEAEYIARSSSAIADVAALLVSRIRERRSEVQVNIGLDIPWFHYYHSVIDKFHKGLCTSNTALNWIDAVDLRHDQIADVYAGFVQNELEHRGVLGAYEIRTSSKSNLVARSIRDALLCGECPCLEDVLQCLDLEKDGLWRNFYSHVPAREQPRNWEDLGYLFYVFEVVRSALIEQVKPETKGNSVNNEFRSSLAESIKVKSRRLIVSIDDAVERRIYSKAQDVLRKLRSSVLGLASPTLMEIYLCRRVFVNGNRERARLYHYESMPKIVRLFQPSEQDNEEGCSIKPLDVVHRLHGANCAHSLQSLFAKVGL